MLGGPCAHLAPLPVKTTMLGGPCAHLAPLPVKTTMLGGPCTHLAPLPVKTTMLGGPCAHLAPSQPSLPSCGADVLTLHLHHHRRHFVSPEEALCSTPQGAPPCPAHPHLHPHLPGPAPLYDPASQDALHEDSVRGLVKLSSV
uniref:Uncharacterized protein n=2 Tax=Cyclopterus lumpus TaxID=8103 RepID=A0A8C2Z541_CYCLU